MMIEMKLTKIRRSWLRRRDVYTMHFLPSLIVFLMMMVLIGFSWRTATRSVETARTEAVEEHARIIETNLRQQLKLYDSALTSTIGLFQTSEEVSRADWRRFVQALDPPKRFPGVLGIGYTEVVRAEDKPRFETDVRAEGFPSFEIFPADPARELYTPILYLEPFTATNQRAFGYDMYSQPVRREAMHIARDTGEPTLSGSVQLIQDNATGTTPGILLYLPHYRKDVPAETTEQKQSSLVGYAYAPIRSIDMFPIIFANSDASYNTEITDVTSQESASIYTHYQDKGSFTWTYESTIDIYGRRWRIAHGVRPEAIAEALRERPRSVLIGGTIFALVVATIVFLLLQRRTRYLAEREGRKVERAKDDLLSLASHQLRTPATGVKQYVGMVLEGFSGKLTSEQQKFLSLAYQTNERQLRIINEFLYLAKADANRVVLTTQDFDLTELVKNTLSDMQTEVQEAGHTVQMKLPRQKVLVSADIHSTRMIIENIVSNAIKYTPAGGKITITVAKKSQDAIVSVEDNGVGIEKSDFPKLFKQFSRIPNPLTKQTSGSGIGLYLAQHLAERNGGEVTVTSQKGAGSTFTLHLPKKNVKKITAQK